jgi:hypothetical protein
MGSIDMGDPIRVTYKFFNPLTRKGDFDKFAATSPEKIRQTNAF